MNKESWKKVHLNKTESTHSHKLFYSLTMSTINPRPQLTCTLNNIITLFQEIQSMSLSAFQVSLQTTSLSILLFIWRLLHYWLYTHFLIQCFFCKKPYFNTKHIFNTCTTAILPNTQLLLSTFLQHPYSSTTLEVVLYYWVIWKTM